MMRRFLRRFWEDESGPTAVEYAIMLALIIGVCVGAVRTMSTAAKNSFDKSAQEISKAIK